MITACSLHLPNDLRPICKSSRTYLQGINDNGEVTLGIIGVVSVAS